MSPRWATDVRRGDEHATVDVITGQVLAGELPPRVLRAVQSLLADNREAAVFAFNETLEHRFTQVPWKQRRRLRMSDLAPLIDATDVRILARYVVELTFADGSDRVIDLEPLLWGPMFEPLLSDYDLFREVTVDRDVGTIVWPNGADLSPRTLLAESRPTIPA